MARFGKLTPSLALAAAAALLVLGLVMGVFVERSYDAQKLREVEVQSQILASSVVAALAFNDREVAREYVDALKANPEILTAAVYDANGTLFASYTRLPGGKAPAAVTTGEPVFEGGWILATTPVTQAGARLGTVYLASITEPLAQRLARWGGIALLVFMVSLLVAVLGVSNSALNRAHRELEARARQLAASNAELLAQIAERERAEEALHQSQKMEAIGQLSGGIAHDFNNILMVARGNLQMMERRMREGRANVTGYLDSIKDAIDRAANLTQRILAFSRRQPLEPKSVDLNRLIQDMDLLLRTSLGESIALEKNLAATWWTRCDENQMENVVLNLTINARDAMPGAGRLTVETANLHADTMPAGFEGAAPGDYVWLAVSDTGTGMTEDVRARAIDPFFTTKPEGRGTGLGLSMIFGYVRQSNGAMKIDSAPGRGTTVTILMPRDASEPVAGAVAPEPAAAVPAAPGPVASPDGAPKVFVVEDEFLARMLVVETLRDEGFEVREEGDGRAAHGVLMSDAGVDLLVTDIKLPGMTGYELAAAGMARRPELKVLLMTGYAQPVPEALARVGVTVLHKPYDLDEFVRRVRQLLGPKTA